MTTRREQFLLNSKKINAALGDPIPQGSSANKEIADRAIVGDLRRAEDGTYAHFDLDRTIDWACEKTYNPGVIQMYLLRFYFLGPIAATYRETGDEKYALIARRYIEAFLRDHPMVEGWKPIPVDGATQYDLRVVNWLSILHAFLPSPNFDDAFFETVINACRLHVVHLANNVYPDRNIRIMNGNVLVTCGVYLSFLPESEGWRELGKRVVNDAAVRQILPDGAHMEAVAGYHGGVMHEFTTLWRLGQAMPELGLNVPTAKLAAMYDYNLATTRPDGAMTSMHDTGYVASRLPLDEHIRNDRANFRKLAKLPDELPPTRQHFPDAGQVYLRDSWTPDATFLTFDATERRSFHWHAGRNTIQLFANGRNLLVDTGYPFKTDEFPHYGTRTAHHSTLNLNGWNQSHASAKLRVRSAQDYDFVEGKYDGGYWPQEGFGFGTGIFGEHYRAMLWLRGRCVIVIDQMYTTSDEGKKPTVEAVWQLSEGGVAVDGKAKTAVTKHDEGNLLMLFPLVPEGTEFSVHEGEREPMRGWLPIEWGRRCIPAPMVRLATPKYDPWTAHYATVLVPFAGKDAPKVTATAVAPDMGFGGRGAGRLEIKWSDGSTDEVVWIRKLENAINQQHGLDTDASLVHMQRDSAGKLVRGLAVDGQFLRCEALGKGELIGRFARC